MPRDPLGELDLAIVMGLRDGLRLCHGMRRQLTEAEQFKIAAKIIEHLAGADYIVTRGPPMEAHGTGWGVPKQKPGEGG